MIRKEIIKKAIKKITDSRGVFVCLFCFVPFTRNAVWPRGNILFVSVPSTAHRSRGHFSFTCEATEPWRLPVTAPRPRSCYPPSEISLQSSKWIERRWYRARDRCCSCNYFQEINKKIVEVQPICTVARLYLKTHFGFLNYRSSNLSVLHILTELILYTNLPNYAILYVCFIRRMLGTLWLSWINVSIQIRYFQRSLDGISTSIGRYSRYMHTQWVLSGVGYIQVCVCVTESLIICLSLT